jgi:hypothetical protein
MHLPARIYPHGRPSMNASNFEVGELRDRLGGLLLPAEAEDIWTAIWYQAAHNSTALEGNTLVLREVEVLLAEGRVVGQKQLKDYMEVRGYADAGWETGVPSGNTTRLPGTSPSYHAAPDPSASSSSTIRAPPARPRSNLSRMPRTVAQHAPEHGHGQASEHRGNWPGGSLR